MNKVIVANIETKGHGREETILKQKGCIWFVLLEYSPDLHVAARLHNEFINVREKADYTPGFWDQLLVTYPLFLLL